MICKTFANIRTYNTWIVAELSKDFGDYYYSLIPKYYYANRQKYITHITIVRTFEDPPFWKNFQGDIEVFYNPVIVYVEPYFFLNCWSKQIINIRRELGLPKYRFKDQKSYHITIGNIKT